MPSIRPAHRRGLATLALTLLTHAVTATGNALHPITPDDLRPHIRILASDAFEGRKAGGSGQEKAIHYIAQQMRKAGLQPGATGGTWYQPVNIVHLIPQQADAFWSIGGKRIDVAPDAIALNGPAGTASIHNGHLVFVGYGLEERGYHNLDGADLRGKVALSPLEGKNWARWERRPMSPILPFRLAELSPH
jgi:hypothetical protein